jgi:hypothetical protein
LGGYLRYGHCFGSGLKQLTACSPMKYKIEFEEAEMNFFRQLFASDLPVTLNTVELVAGLKAKMLAAKPSPEPAQPIE